MILSANCPYFSRMLNSGLRESTQAKISIDISFDLWYQIMVYCYGGKVIIDSENCVELLRIADKFGLPGLKILCELYIGKAIDEENVEAIQQIASLFNSERLMSHCEFKSKKIKIPDPMLIVDTIERVEKV
uniref:BTB domain-containing protein n=1 Tax=Arcella intermedia TaxID=1963864 RepID=A0A6B2LNF0_9EUKA